MSVSQTAERRMVRWLPNNELQTIYVKVFVANKELQYNFNYPEAGYPDCQLSWNGLALQVNVSWNNCAKSFKA